MTTETRTVQERLRAAHPHWCNKPIRVNGDLATLGTLLNESAERIEALEKVLQEARSDLVRRVTYQDGGDHYCDMCGAASPHPIDNHHAASCPIAKISAALSPPSDNSDAQAGSMK